MLRLRWESALLLLGVGSLLAAKEEMKYPHPNLHAQKKRDALSRRGKRFDLYSQLKRLLRMMASLAEQHEPQFGWKGYN